MEDFDWSRFTVRINVRAAARELYERWATPAGIESWFLRLGEFTNSAGAQRQPDEALKTGDTYRWRWFGYPDEVTETGTVLLANGANKFSFSFGEAGDCEVSILEESGETIVQLLQEKIPVSDYGKHQWHVGCKTGWTFYLANLKSMVEAGVDLRNKNDQLTRMINC